MIIGIPKEIKTRENRVSMTPEGVKELVDNGHTVIFETMAGIGSGFHDDAYKNAGAVMETDAENVWSNAEMIVKVKEPVETEYAFFRPGLILFTYLHLAANFALTKRLLADKVTAIAYETIELEDGTLPLLKPMSEIAGKVGTQEAAVLLERHNGGKGVLMGGAAGVAPARVLVLGGGISGKAAARIAIGMGADVTVLDINNDCLKRLGGEFNEKCKMMYSSPENIKNILPKTDIVIGCVLIPGAKSPKVITRDMLAIMEPGSIMVDIAIDQGGCFETSRPTTHDDPVYTVDGVIHYCVTNMPGVVPRTSTLALSKATLPWILKIAGSEIAQSVKSDMELSKGVNTMNGYMTYEPVAIAFGLEYTPLYKVLNEGNVSQ